MPVSAAPGPPAAALGARVRAVLETAEPRAKVMRARALRRDWRAGRLAHDLSVGVPDRPGRPARPELLPPSAISKRGKLGSARGRVAMLHALAHIELNALDLALDIVGRLGAGLPPAFADDWLSVAADEALHFALLDRRLRALSTFYGALPAHDGLWEAAASTADNLLARLVIVPTVLEARGLDVTPATVRAFAAAGDPRSAAILQRIYLDEIRHVGFGMKWFGTLCAARGLAPADTWRELVRSRFRGSLKPPFNDSARRQAGLPRDYYAALAS